MREPLEEIEPTMPDYYVRWSEREGLSEVRTQIQDSGMDYPLRADLWNALCDNIHAGDTWRDLVRRICREVLHEPLDEYLDTNAEPYYTLKEWILRADWPLPGDVVALIGEELNGPPSDSFVASANVAFDRGKFAWRFSGRELVRRMGEAEIKAVEVALQDSQPFAEVRKQLETALQEFSSRENANYGHAAKEAISAVETLCRRIVGNPNITLGDALKEIGRSGKLEIHGALLTSFGNLYGYASDKGCLRHGAKPGDLSDVTLEEAQLVLVTSSAIVSFLIARADCEGVLE